MKITIDISKDVYDEVVRWERKMDKKGYELTGLMVWEGASKQEIVEARVPKLVKEGLQWEKERYGDVVNNVETGTCDAE